MRKFKTALIAIFLVAFTGLFASLTLLNFPIEKHNDMSAINEIVKTVETHWNDIDELEEVDFFYDFAILEKNGSLLLKTKDNLPDSLHYGIMKGLSIIDITVQGETVGKAMIDTTWQSYMEQTRAQLFTILAFSFSLIFLLLILFIVALNHIVLSPFRRLEKFTREIAYGNLDLPLPMDQYHIFGPFTESFDIMRQALKAAKVRELQADKSKKELVASLSHDIRTPITSIKLITELLQATTTNSGLLEKLTTIEAKATQIEQLMNNMLHTTLEEMEELPVSLRDEDSNTLVTIFQNEDTLKRVCLPLVPPACLLSMDKMRMEQVVGNIIHNSYKYAGTEIEVQFHLIDSYLQITIKDYGAGVKAEELEYLFNKFYRGSNGIDSKKSGAGLGLHITKTLMERMGGFAECQNHPDGFVICLYLPLST